MTRCTAAEAQRRLFQLLDAAQRGEEVILDRKGVRFRLLVEPTEPISPPPSPFVIDDPDLLSGEWTWVSDDMGQLDLNKDHDHLQQLRILDLFGAIDYDPDLDYKAQRQTT